MTRLVFALVAAWTLSGCDRPSGATCPDASPHTYANFGQPFFQTYCLRCHSESRVAEDRNDAPPDVNFDTVEQIRQHAHAIDHMAAAGPDRVNRDMPPSDPDPTDEERQKLGEWLACGAP